MKSINSQSRNSNFSLLSWALAVLALAFGFAATATATEPSYQNYSVLDYSIPGTPPPTIDASNFVNYNQFNVSFNSLQPQNESGGPLFYEPMNTVNYTNESSGINTGIMTANSPLLTNNIFGEIGGFSYNTAGVGFEFDTQTTNTIPHQMAGTFFNSGDIHCDSVVDGNNLTGGAFTQGNAGQCLVWATNIICPGTIDTSENGFIQLTGSNVDLTRADLTEEQQFFQGFSPSNVELNASIDQGFNDYNVWIPSDDLSLTGATSSPPDNLTLTNSTPYVAEQEYFTTSTTNIVIQALFLMNANTNIPASVYMVPSAFPAPAFQGNAIVQWVGTYADPLTGLTKTNYLYLYHNFLNGTNILPVLAIGQPQPSVRDILNPDYYQNYFNFVWAPSTQYPGLGAPTAPGFQGINFIEDEFVFGNPYEDFNGNLGVTTVSTNASANNPSGSLTNLPARIQITASGDLKLANAVISGQNYLSLTATNRFDGSPGALIYSPYSDINLGTGGYTNTLTVSNLLVAQIPNWSGTLDEWGTTWSIVISPGFTVTYQVSLVYADLMPTLQPQVQNLNLTATNVVISDVLNIFGSTFTSAQSLTLTTNFSGSGPYSPDGELDMQLESPLTWSWNGSFPNLLFLTNSGAIRAPNFCDFVSTSTMTNYTPPIPTNNASAILAKFPSTNTAIIAAGGTVTIGNTSYTFVSKLVNTTAFQVKIGTNFNLSMSNLIDAINGGPGSGTNYSSDTFASSVAVAGSLNVTNGSIVISANPNSYSGTLGNGIAVSTTVTNLAWNSTILTGGSEGVPGSTTTNFVSVPYGAIINNGYIANQGSTIWVTNFLNGGVISNGPGSFDLTSFTTTLTNGAILAGGDISFATSNLLASDVMMQAGRSLVFQVTNFLWDGGVSNGNVWTVGATNGTGGNGLVLPFLPGSSAAQLNVSNNLLGTTISVVAPPQNREVANYWAGLDYNISNSDTTIGYNTNNVAIGQLVLNCLSPDSTLYFSGPGGSTNNNAIYVDRLVLLNYASLADLQGSGGIPTLVFNNNTNAGHLTIYYADAVASESVTGGPLLDVSYLLSGLNNGHFQWLPEYTGYFSATNMVYANGTTNRLNIGLVTSPYLDSNGSGVPNSSDPSPVFTRSQMNFQILPTTVNGSNELVWDSPPGATNYLLYCTTNYANWNIMPVLTNSDIVPPPAGWPITNTLYEVTNANSASYRIKIIQDNGILYGQ